MPERTEILLGDAADQLAPAALADWVQSQPAKQRARLWMAGSLTHELLAPPDLRSAPGHAWPDYARRLAGHYGLAAEGLLASWRSREAAGASLSHPAIDAAMLQRGAPRGAHPLWLGALALALPRLAADGELLVVETSLATRIGLHRGELQRVERFWLPQQGAEAGVRAVAGTALVVGERFADTPADSALRFAGAAEWAAALASLPALAAPNFADLPAPASHRRLGWGLAATGALVLAVAGWEAAAARQAWQATLQAQRAPASAIARSLPAPQLEAPRATPAVGAAGNKEQAELQRMSALLLHPWASAFATTDALAPRGGRWLGLEHQAGESALKLEGQAADIEAALDAVRRLGDLPEVLNAQLMRGEQRPDGKLYFELRLRLRGVAP